MSNTPSISSPRLILRAFRPTDNEDLYSYLSSEQVYQFESGETIDLIQARKMAQELAGKITNSSWSMWPSSA